MRRLISWLIMIPMLVVVATFALNNTQGVALDLWPFAVLLEMPLYLALLLALFLGAMLGGLAAWAGQGRVRAKAREQAYEREVATRQLADERERVTTLERELDRYRVRDKAESQAIAAYDGPAKVAQETLAPTPPLNPPAAPPHTPHKTPDTSRTG